MNAQQATYEFEKHITQECDVNIRILHNSPYWQKLPEAPPSYALPVLQPWWKSIADLYFIVVVNVTETCCLSTELAWRNVSTRPTQTIIPEDLMWEVLTFKKLTFPMLKNRLNQDNQEEWNVPEDVTKSYSLWSHDWIGLHYN